MRGLVTPFRLALAFLAAVFSGAAPALAVSPLLLTRHPGYADICTERGLAPVPLGAPSGDDESPAGKLSHCALCLTSGSAYALGGSAQPLLAPERAERPAPVALATRTPVEPVRSAQPRGPPAVDSHA
jgi:hypothetical protein